MKINKHRRFWLYLPLMLVMTGVLASNQISSPERLAEKFATETVNIVKDYTSFLNGQESPLTKQISPYTVEEYGAFAAPLNKLKQVMDFSKQEAKAIAQAIPRPLRLCEF
jgi:hypothetical protein